MSKQPWEIWTNDLTDAQLKMLIDSGDNQCGVELRGASWATARALQAKGLGSIEGDPGASLSGLFFANDEGVRILHEFGPEEDDDDLDAEFDAVCLKRWGHP